MEPDYSALIDVACAVDARGGDGEPDDDAGGGVVVDAGGAVVWPLG